MDKLLRHLSDEELFSMLSWRAQRTPLWSVWHHWKDTQVTYRIVDLVVIETNDLIGIIYEQSSSWLRFVRPAEEFIEILEKEKYSWPRFIRLGIG